MRPLPQKAKQKDRTTHAVVLWRGDRKLSASGSAKGDLQKFLFQYVYMYMCNGTTVCVATSPFILRFP